MEGWIKLHRTIVESVVFRSPNLLKVWIYCLLRSNHKSGYKDFFGGKEVTLQAGQFITGRFQGAEDCNMPHSTFRNQIQRLIEIGNIVVESDNKKSIITIVNWGQYQFSEINSDNKRTTVGQQKDTDKNDSMREVIGIALSIVSTKNKAGVESLIQKYQSQIKEQTFLQIMKKLHADAKTFSMISQLDAYLKKVVQSEKPTREVSKLNLITEGEEGWR